MRISNDNSVYIGDEIAWDDFAKIEYKPSSSNNVYFKDNVLYIQAPAPRYTIETSFIQTKILDYVLDAPKNVKIPECTKLSLLYWIYGALVLANVPGYSK